MFTVGVEEEFHLIDPSTRQIASGAEKVLSRTRSEELEPELQKSQLETGTPVCETLGELREELARLRAEAAAAAEAVGLKIAASGTHPLSDWRSTETFPKDAYLRLERNYQQLAREQVVCGCHVHVGFDDPEAAIYVMNRLRPWLPPILALSANSPFWMGEATGYYSYRNRIWQRWPISGMPGTFRSRMDYDSLIKVLMSTGSIDDPARIYWDVRPSNKFNTLEIRIADVCMNLEDSLLVAALIRGLCQACHEQTMDGVAVDEVRSEVLQAAVWRAARFGEKGELLDGTGAVSIPAWDMFERLLDFVTPTLRRRDELDEVTHLLERVRRRGTGATRQIRAYEESGRLEEVVDLIVQETAPLASRPGLGQPDRLEV